MAALIEDQIHQALINHEEERCTALEEAEKKKVKRRKIAKPWQRPNISALCQEGDLLLLVHDYDYDLGNVDFQKYCEARGTIHVAGEPDSKRWQFFEYFNKTKEQYLKDKYFQYAKEFNGKRYQYSNDEMETGWKIIQLGRAKLQDCWEIYSHEQRI